MAGICRKCGRYGEYQCDECDEREEREVKASPVKRMECSIVLRDQDEEEEEVKDVG